MIKDQGAMNWHKSSYSIQNGECVEQGTFTGTGETAVRDTKDRGAGSVLRFGSSSWETFVKSVR